MRSFSGKNLLFAFPDFDVYDAGTAAKHYSDAIRLIDNKGKPLGRLTSTQSREVLKQKAKILNRPPPPVFYPSTSTEQEDAPWIFRIVTPAGKELRTAVWDGRRNYAHGWPIDILQWVGGEKIVIVQVDRPIGINRRSSLDLTHKLAKDFDGVIHWARDTPTFQSILKSFIRLDLESVGPLELSQDWKPEVMIFGANC